MFLSVKFIYANILQHIRLFVRLINRESPDSKSGRNKKNKARPRKMYNIRLKIKKRECVTFFRRNALVK